MNTKYVMISSAVLLGFVGLSFTFFPKEILFYFDSSSNKFLLILIQILGALFFAFAMLNWMTKSAAIGGVYSRPITIANLTHFMMGSLMLVKNAFSSTNLSIVLVIITIIYSGFAVFFGIILFHHPSIKNLEK